MIMKKAKDMLNEIKSLLGVELSEEQEIVLAKLNLENGTVLESEDFNSGSEVFILTEDESVALPVGEYKLEDGRILEVAEEGIIAEIKAEKEEEESEEEKPEEKEEMGYATKEELAEVKEMIEEIKAMIDGKDKEEMEAEEPKEELSKQEPKEELAEVSRVRHNPEAQATTKNLLYAQKRPATTMDRVLSKISNINN